jgi:hypothetical protein
VAKKLADDQQKHAMAWKETAEDARQKKRADHTEVKASEKQLNALSNAMELERSCHEEDIRIAKLDVKVSINAFIICKTSSLVYRLSSL